MLGAGIFIDRILVTEEREKEDLDARQYLYICNKWFDTGQVDGRIERQLKLTAFSEIASIPLGRDSSNTYYLFYAITLLACHFRRSMGICFAWRSK